MLLIHNMHRAMWKTLRNLSHQTHFWQGRLDRFTQGFQTNKCCVY